MRRLSGALVVGWLLLTVGFVAGDEPKKNPTRVTEPGKLPDDARLGKLRNLYDKYHPWTPPAEIGAWESESKAIRTRVLVSTGLWPMPPKTPLNAVVHGKVDKGDYTVEKVYFQSYPGHYVTGSLYRPKGSEKHAGVLCPHGHWANGRFYDAGDKAAEDQIKQGAEKHNSGAHFPLQARMVGLARMGCVVFHYDMVGVADSKGIAHREGLTDTEAELRLQSHMGLQTWNSIRALDFLTSLPDVDASRIGVTGASGGGTQTFMLCAVDPRPTAAFPAVMVSTDMQGGCVCENADYLRIGLNNIALAALFAPKPQAMSGADDWTINIETKGLPELKQVYSLYGKTDLVAATTFKQFKHNYNQVAREMMYGWFNEHLKLGQKSPVEERDFEPIPPAELTVWDDKHPVPDDVANPAKLRDYLTATANKQLEELTPTTPAKLAEYKKIVGAAARVMLDDGVPAKERIETLFTSAELGEGVTATKGTISRKGSGEKVPFLLLTPKKPSGTLVLGINPDRGIAALIENGKPERQAQMLLESGHAIAGVDVFLTGEFVEAGKDAGYPKLEKGYGGYTFGYNRPVLSNRVRDVLTAVAAAKTLPGVKRVVLLARGEAGPWGLLARSLAGDQLDDALIETSNFDFAQTMPSDDPNFLPGALKYGGLYGLAMAGAPARVLLVGEKPEPARFAHFEATYASAPGALSLVQKLDLETIKKRLESLTLSSKFDKPVEIDFRRTPLREAVAYIAENIGTEIKIDGDALKMEGYTQNMAQDLTLGVVPAKRGLREIVGKYKELCLVNSDSGAVTLTTARGASRLGRKPLDLAE